MIQRVVLTIPFTGEGPDELTKLLEIANTTPLEYIGNPFWRVKPDGVRLLCIPIEIPIESIPDGV